MVKPLFTSIKALWLEYWTYTANYSYMDHPVSVPYIVVGIDGTGSRQWRKPDGSNSSVYKFIDSFQIASRTSVKRFFDGPSGVKLGLDSEPILHEALNFIYNHLRDNFPLVQQRNVKPLTMFDVNKCHQVAEQQIAAQQAEYGFLFSTPSVHIPMRVTTQMLSHQLLSTDQVRIVIVGHSRGGLIATVLARMLSPIVKVFFLGLYDAVDRQPCYDGSIVENVKFVFHARRHADVGSRSYFGNTATVYHSDFHEEQYFYTSHGGVGGSFSPGEFDRNWVPDNSCYPQPPTPTIATRAGAITVPNINPLTRRFGKSIDQICADGGQRADAFIREGARRAGLPVH